MAGKKTNKPYSGPVRLVTLEAGDTIQVILCKEGNGKLIEQKKFSDSKQYKKYCKAQKDKYDEVETLRIKDPGASAWYQRYDLTEWKEDAFQVPNTASLLDCFTALCDDSQHCPKAQAPLLLLGTFLSGYTSEVFSDIEYKRSGSSKVKAVVLNSPWREGITDFLHNLTEAFSLNLYQRMKTDCHLHFKPAKRFSASNEIKQIKPVANPYWTRTLHQLPFNGKTTEETIIGKVQIPISYQNAAVLIEQWTGLQSRSVEDFLRQNPFCAAVVVRKTQTHIAAEGQLPLNSKELIWADESFHSWKDLKYLLHAFIRAVFNAPDNLMEEISGDVWSESEILIARYRAQKGVARLTVTQRRTWRILLSRVDCCLDLFPDSQEWVDEALRVIRRSKVMKSYKEQRFPKADPNHKEKNNHSWRVRCKTTTITAYDKTFQLLEEELIEQYDAPMLRFEISRTSAKFKRGLSDEIKGSNKKILHTVMEDSKKEIHKYLKSIHADEPFVKYEECIRQIETIPSKKKRMHMKLLTDKLSDCKSYWQAVENSKLSASQLRAVEKAFQELGISPISLRNQTPFDKLQIIE